MASLKEIATGLIRRFVPEEYFVSDNQSLNNLKFLYDFV